MRGCGERGAFALLLSPPLAFPWSLSLSPGSSFGLGPRADHLFFDSEGGASPPSGLKIIYCEKIRVFKAGKSSHLNTLAWNNKIGLRFYFVGF